MMPGQNQNIIPPPMGSGLPGLSGPNLGLQGTPPGLDQLSDGEPADLQPVPAPLRPIESDMETQVRTEGQEGYGLDGVIPASQACPGPLKDERKKDELANVLRECILAGVQIVQATKKRRDRNAKFYRNRPDKAVTGGRPWSKAPTYHVPLLAQRFEQRKSHVVETLTSPSPMFFLTRVADNQRANDVEADLQYILENSNFEEALRDAIDNIMHQNTVHVKIDFVNMPGGNPNSAVLGPYCGPEFTTIVPDDTVVFPANNPNLVSQKMVGHRFEMRRADIKAKQATKVWFDTPSPLGTASEIRTEDPQSLQAVGRTSSLDDDNIILWDVLVRFDADDDGIEEVYRVITDPDSCEIYRIEEYKSTESKYIPLRIYKDLNAYWSEDSPVQNGQSIQLMWNEFWNNILWAFMYNTRPPSVGPSVSGNTSLMDMKPGQFAQGPNADQIKVLAGQMNLTGTDFLIQSMMALADGVTKVPDTMSAGPAYNKSELATTQNIKFTGFQLSGSDDIKAIEISLRMIVRKVMWLIYRNFDRLKLVYGNSLKCTSGDLFWQPYTINLAGTKPQASPDLQQQQIMTMLQLFAQMPQLQVLVLDLVEKFVNQSSLEGKDDLVQEIQEIREQQEAAQQQQQLLGMLQQLPPEQLAAFVQAHGGQQALTGQPPVR